MHCINVAQLLYPFPCQWIPRLLPCPGYCKYCCNEHWGTCYLSELWFSQGICPVVVFNIRIFFFSTLGFKANNSMFNILVARQILGRKKESIKDICSLSAFSCNLYILLNYHSYIKINDVLFSQFFTCHLIIAKSLHKYFTKIPLEEESE